MDKPVRLNFRWRKHLTKLQLTQFAVGGPCAALHKALMGLWGRDAGYCALYVFVRDKDAAAAPDGAMRSPLHA